MALAFLGVPRDESVLPLLHEANLRLQEYMQGFGDDPAKLEALEEHQHAIHAMWGPVFEERRREPKNDLISKLIAMSETLPDWDEKELSRQALFFFGASFGNSANTIANAVYILARDRDIQEELRTHPERIPRFVDEVLRAWASVQFRVRIVAADTNIGGQLVRQGERVIPLVAAANRNEVEFPHPDVIDPTRRNTRQHLTFGAGPRYCVGATLARYEVEQVVRTLLSGDHDFSLVLQGDDPQFAGLNYRVWKPLHLAARDVADSPVSP